MEPSLQMNIVKFTDDQGETLKMQEDAGTFFTLNVEAQNLLSLDSFTARSDDILLVTYPKSGTHWLDAIVKMMVQHLDTLSTDRMHHLEYSPSAEIERAPSPRVLCTHLPFWRIPIDFLRKRVKIILCVRNPRDVAVSYFHFCSNMSVIGYDGNFDGFLSLFLKGYLPYNSWFHHVSSWLKAARSHTHNVHVLFYEDLQQTSFANMKKLLGDSYKHFSKNGHHVIYRKGRVGDWSNFFNPAQIVQFNTELEAWGLQEDKQFLFSVE
ncbi:sulfotransferase [Plakobranchus ocellatus]|uniref:Sulfotransferase n=1 Tax=Plakobranchus ocellatus TaxID=259542 RepID=A0AAV4A3B4_9GAST|nr:sulfotransferase [Plakobranchus ocellatus]